MANSSLIQQFIKTYSSAQAAIDNSQKKAAEQSYHKLLQKYDQIKNSNLDYNHKKIAYNQIQKVYKGINSINTTRNINKYAIAAAVCVVILSMAIAIKPSIFGLSILEKGLYDNEGPKWTSEQKTFELNKILEINLDNYFTDPDEDELTYLTKHQKGLKIALAGNKLKIMNDNSKGEIPLELIATDGRIITRETVMINAG